MHPNESSGPIPSRMANRRPKKKRGKLYALIAALAVAAGGSVAAVAAVGTETASADTTLSSETVGFAESAGHKVDYYKARSQVEYREPVGPQLSEVKSTMGFFGNIYWGRYVHTQAMQSGLGYEQPFSRLHEFGHDDYDAWIAGMECPSVAGLEIDPVHENNTLLFNCKPEYLPEVAKWFDVVTLANNHTNNQGVEGFEETKKNLDEVGIQYFGHYDPDEIDDLCDVIAVPAQLTFDDGNTVEGKLPIAMCGHHTLGKLPEEAGYDVVTEYAEHFPVIAMPHMGIEYVPEPSEDQTYLYRRLIDAGAEAVIGDHPHWIQTTEAYNGHLIVNSMGNFIFDQQMDGEVTRSSGIKLVLTSDGMDTQELETLTELAEECVAYQAGCLEKAQEMNLKKGSYTYEFSPIPSRNMGSPTHPAPEGDIPSIMDRLRWADTIAALEYPYSGI